MPDDTAVAVAAAAAAVAVAAAVAAAEPAVVAEGVELVVAIVAVG